MTRKTGVLGELLLETWEQRLEYQTLVLHSTIPFASYLTSRVIDCTHRNSRGVIGEAGVDGQEEFLHQGNGGGQGAV